MQKTSTKLQEFDIDILSILCLMCVDTFVVINSVSMYRHRAQDEHENRYIDDTILILAIELNYFHQNCVVP